MPEAVVPAVSETKPSLGEQLATNLQANPPAAQVPPGSPPAETTTPPEPVVRSLAEQVKELGFTDVNDDAEAATRLLAAFQERDAQAQQSARRAQELEELSRLREQHAQQNPTHQQPPFREPTISTDKWWNPPQVDQVAVDFYRNDDGTWKPEAPQEIRQQVQRYDTYHKQWAEKMVRKPDEAFTPLVNQLVERALAERMAALESTTSEEAAKQRFIRESDWAFAVDPVTNSKRRDATGAFIPSAEGLRFGQYMDQAAELGITSVAQQIAYANRERRLAQLEAQLGQQTTTQTAQEINEQKKQELLRRALPTPSQGGTLVRPGENRTQNPNLTAGDRLRATLQRDGALVP